MSQAQAAGKREAAHPALEHTLAATRRQRRKLLLAVGSGFLLLALACGAAGYLAWRLMRFNEQVIATVELRRTALVLRGSLLESESGQRLFLLTQDASDLATFRAAVQLLPARLAALEQAAFMPHHRDNALTARHAGEAALAMLQRPIDPDLARGMAADPSARQAIATALTAAGALATDATDELMQLTAGQRRLGAHVVLWIVLCLAAAAALAAGLLRDTRQHLRQLAGREVLLLGLSTTADQRVAQRTLALSEANLRLEIALSATGVTVAIQDSARRFTWISKGEFGHTAEAMVGQTDEEVNPDPSMASVVALKRGVVETGEPARRELCIVHDGAERWIDLSVQPLPDGAGATVGLIAAAIDVTRYKEQEARIRLLMREVTHRSKNLLAVIDAITRQTANSATSLADFQTRFSSRLQSLAGSHDLLVQEDWSGASLGALVRSQLGHFADDIDSQVEITGPPLHLQPDAAQHIGMALHELATNAACYGALSVAGGKVVVGWTLLARPDQEEACTLSWQEMGGPPVIPPTRRGFGRIVIERAVARAVQGNVKADYLPDGLHWTLTFPASLIVRN